MDANITISLEEFPDSGGMMGREIIGDNVDLLALGQAGDNLFKKSNKLGTGVTKRSLAQHLAGFGVERRVKRKGAVPVVLKTVPLDSSGGERQYWIEPVQRLDGALFVDAENRSVHRRLQIQPNDISSLGFKIRIVAGHVAAQAVGLQSGFGQNSGHSGMVGAKFGCQLPSTPVRRTVLGFMAGRSQNLRFELGALLAGYLATMTTEKAGQTFIPKALQPKAHGVDAASQLPTYRPSRPAARDQEDNLGSLRLFRSPASGSGSLSQSSTFWRRKNQSS